MQNGKNCVKITRAGVPLVEGLAHLTSTIFPYMSFLESLDRLSLTLHKVSAVAVRFLRVRAASPRRQCKVLRADHLARTLSYQSHAANPIGPFTTSLEQPFGSILRDAEPGEREMFRYVG